jgi:hypothetical protein
MATKIMALIVPVVLVEVSLLVIVIIMYLSNL